MWSKEAIITLLAAIALMVMMWLLQGCSVVSVQVAVGDPAEVNKVIEPELPLHQDDPHTP